MSQPLLRLTGVWREYAAGDEAIAALVLQLVRIEGRSALANAPLAHFVDERALVLSNLAAWGSTGIATAEPLRVLPEALKLIDRLRRFEKSEGVVNMALVKDVASLDELSP